MSLPATATPALLLQRLRILRRAGGLQHDDGQRTAIIIVAGADGCDSGGSRALQHYLLGRSGSDVLSSPTSAADPSSGDTASSDSSALDELVWVVSSHGLGVVCTPATRAAVERLTARVAGVSILCRAEEEFGNTDEDELFKIHSFIALTQPFEQVLVPVLKGGGGVGSDTQQQQARWDEEVKEEVETWPIVQAYGLDELGRHGFFTLSHTVRALNFSGLDVLSDVDSASVLHLLTQRMPSFNAQIQSTCARMLSHAAAPAVMATGAHANAGAAAARDLTVAQVNADLRTYWEYGVESLADESVRAERRAAHAQAPSGLFFFGPRGCSDWQSDTLVRSSGFKHYASLSSYYSRLLQAHPYLPLDGLVPSLSPWSHAPLHALLRLCDPLTGVTAVRTLLLRQITPLHENEVEVLDALVPQAWKKKKRSIVASDDADAQGEDEESEESEQEESEQESSSSEEEEDSDAASGSDSEERKERASKSSKPAPAKAAKAVPPRLKKESPGLKDAQLLAHLYAILVQVASGVLRELVNGPTPTDADGASSQQARPAQQQGAVACFPSFATLRDRVASLVQHLVHAKWILPRWFESLRTQERPAGALASPTSSSSPAGPVLGVELWRIDAFGRRTPCDLSRPMPLEEGGGVPIRRVYSFALYLHGIPSAELLSLTDDDVQLGSVGFGESFVRDSMPAGGAGAAPGSKASKLSAEEQAEEKRRQDDPTYYGTGLTSSSAIDAAAQAASAAAAASSQSRGGASGASVLVLTAAVPSLITLPSFYQLYELKALQAMLSSYSHASARSALQSAAEVAAAGLVPIHPSLGPFLLDASTPRLQSNLLARPPTSALVGAGARVALFDPTAYLPPVCVGQRVEGATTPLYLWRTDQWISSSPLAGAPSTALLLSTPLHPALHGSLACFERGFVFHSSSVGSFMVDFAKHVLECAYFDGSAEWGQAASHEEEDDDDDDDGADDHAPVVLEGSGGGGLDPGAESDPHVGDALFILDLMEPGSESESQSTPYTLLRSLDTLSAQKMPSLAPLATNEGVPPSRSRFARAAFSVAIVLPKGSALARSWTQSIQQRWSHALEELNIHNDHTDAVPAFARGAYAVLQEQHEFQRREARRAKMADAHKQQQQTPSATPRRTVQHEDDDEGEDGDDGGPRSPSHLTSGSAAAAAASLVLPDATCDFLQDYRVHEQMRLQSDAQRVNEGRALLTKSKTVASSHSSTATSASIPVSLVIGTPGPGHAALLGAVQEHDAKVASSAGGGSNGAERWVTAVLGGGDDVFEMDMDRAASALNALAADAGRLRSSGNGSSAVRVLVVVSTYAGVVPVVELLHRLLLDGASSTPSSSLSFHLTSVTTLLHACSFFVGPSHSLTAPGAADQLAAGWTGSLLLFTPAPPSSDRDASLVTGVRARIRTASMPASTDLRVVAQGARLAFRDVEEMLCSTRYTSAASRRRRATVRLMTSPEPVPRSLAPGGPTSAGSRVHFFHLSPAAFLFDRVNFLRSLVRFTCQRGVYHSDVERHAEEEHARVKLARLLDSLDGGHSGSASSAASKSLLSSSSSGGIGARGGGAGAGGGRIVFTTSDESLPAEYTVLHVAALLKFEDSVSNAGGCSHSFLLVHASNGYVWARPVSFDTGAGRGKTRAPRHDEAQASGDDEERKEGNDEDSASASPAPDADPGCPIPMSALPLDIAQFVRAQPAALHPTTGDSAAAAIPSAAAHASSALSASSPTAAPTAGPSPLSTSRTSCLLLVSGCGLLDRSSVRRDLLRPSLRNPRPYEKADSRWNAELKRQMDDINKV